MTKEELIERSTEWYAQALEGELNHIIGYLKDDGFKGWLRWHFKENGESEASVSITLWNRESPLYYAEETDFFKWIENDSDIAEAIDDALDQALGEDRPNAVVKFVDGLELKLNIKLCK